MPSINQHVPYLSGVFDESESNMSGIFPLGGPFITLHVTKNENTDIGSVTLRATNVEYFDGASDEYMGWQTIAVNSVEATPVTVPSYYAYGQLLYTGKGKIGCAYTDSRETSGAGGDGTNINFGVTGEQIAFANTSSQVRQILQLGNLATFNATALGQQIISASTTDDVKTLLQIGNTADLSIGTIGGQIISADNANQVKTLLSIGSAADLNAGNFGQQLIGLSDYNSAKSLLQLGNLSSITASSDVVEIISANSRNDIRNSLSIGTAASLNYGNAGKSILESAAPSDVKTILGIGFGTTSTTYATGDHIHANYIDKAIGGQYTAHVGTSMVPSLATDFVNKQYVDTLVSGFKYKSPTKVATTQSITLSGIQTIDGILINNGDRVLVKDQLSIKDNGIYVASSGSWLRATDFDEWIEIPASLVIIESGQTLADTAWICISDESGTLGVTDINFVQNFSASQQLLQGPGIDISGNTIRLEESGIVSGTYSKITCDKYGRATYGSNLTPDDIKYLLGYTPVQNGGDASLTNSLIKIGESTQNDGIKAIADGGDLGYFIMSGDPTLGRSRLGLSAAATMSIGTSSNTLASGDHNHDTIYMSKSGGLFTSNAGCNSAPSLPSDYANKNYVDSVIGSGSSASNTFTQKFGYGPSTFLKVTDVGFATTVGSETSTTRRYIGSVTMNCLSGVIETTNNSYSTSTTTKAVAINNSMVNADDIVIAKIQWPTISYLSPNYFTTADISTYIDPTTSALVFRIPPTISTTSGILSIRFIVIKST